MFKTIKKIAITGSQGFVGNHLVKYTLENTDAQIICLVRGPAAVHPASSHRIHFIDLQQFLTKTISEKDRSILEGCEAIVHLAARAHVMKEENPNPEKAYLEANTELSLKVLEANYHYKIPHFVYMSTLKVMGEENPSNTSRGFLSTDIAKPEDFYGISKLKAESLIQDFCTKNPSISYTILRPPLIYGPEVRANFLKLLKFSSSKLPLPFEGVKNKRSFVFVLNLCDFILFRIENAKNTNEIFFPHDGKALSLRELLHAMAIGMGKQKANLFFVPAIVLKFLLVCIGKKNIYQRLFSNFYIDENEITEKTGWRPPFDTKKAFQMTGEWYLMNQPKLKR